MSYSDKLMQSRAIRMLGPWVHHRRLWRVDKHSVAGGVAIGLASGLIPGPFQILSAAILAGLFKVNLPIALVTTFYTNPFTIVPLYVLAYTLGSLITGESADDIDMPELSWNPLQIIHTIRELGEWIMSMGPTLVIGLLLQVALFSIAGYGLVRLGWRLCTIHEWRKRRERRIS